ncbi:MAG: metal-dependent hydrolase [Haloferacaceae archaeon]
MPNYPTHARWGRRAAAVVSLLVGGGLYATFATPLPALAAAGGAAATTFAGSIYPDVDHHESIPRRKAARTFRVFALFGVLSLGMLHWERLVELAAMVPLDSVAPEVAIPVEVVASGGIVAVALIAATLVDPLLGTVTRRHRAWTHSVPINLGLTGIVAAGVWLFVRSFDPAYQVASVAVVVAFFAGCLVHLGLDGEIA